MAGEATVADHVVGIYGEEVISRARCWLCAITKGEVLDLSSLEKFFCDFKNSPSAYEGSCKAVLQIHGQGQDIRPVSAEW